MLVRPTKNYMNKSKTFLKYFSSKYNMMQSDGNMGLFMVEGYRVMLNPDYSLMFLGIYDHDHANILNIVMNFEEDIKKGIKGFEYVLPNDLLKIQRNSNLALAMA